MRFQEIEANPAKHFFPTLESDKENIAFYSGPPGLPKQLQALFQVNLGGRNVLGARRPAQAQRKGTQKNGDREGTAAEDGTEVEIGRERQPSLDYGFDFDGGIDSDGLPRPRQQ